jgi:hypothetical protein
MCSGPTLHTPLREQPLDASRAFFFEDSARLFKSFRRDVASRCQYYIFWIGHVFRAGVEELIWRGVSPVIVRTGFSHVFSNSRTGAKGPLHVPSVWRCISYEWQSHSLITLPLVLMRGPGKRFSQVLQGCCDCSMVLVALLLSRLRRDGLEESGLSILLGGGIGVTHDVLRDSVRYKAQTQAQAGWGRTRRTWLAWVGASLTHARTFHRYYCSIHL